MRNKIFAKIDFAPNSNLSGTDVVIPTTNFPFSSISKTNNDTLQKNNGVGYLMVMGDSLNKGTTISENDFWVDKDYRYNGFTGGLTNDLGVLSPNITMTLKATTNAVIDNITIFFDNEAQQWATEAYLDNDINNKIYSDDNEWAILFPTPATTHTITFTKWNRPNYNARITFLGFELDEKIFDKRWYKDISLTQQIMSLQAEPFFDVMSCTGTIDLNDVNGELRDFAVDGILQSNLPCEIFINDYKMSTSIVNEWGAYDVQGKQVKANLVDRLAYLDNAFGGISLQENKTAWQVLDIIKTASGLTFDTSKIIITGTGTDLTEKTITAHLQSINIQYTLLKTSTMREALAKICQLGLLVIYYTASGYIYFDTARPRLTAQEKSEVIVIEPTTQIADFQEVIQPKNNYSGVEYTTNVILTNEEIIGKTQKVTYRSLNASDSGNTSNDVWTDPNWNIYANTTSIINKGSNGYYADYWRTILTFDLRYYVITEEIIKNTFQIREIERRYDANQEWQDAGQGGGYFMYISSPVDNYEVLSFENGILQLRVDKFKKQTEGSVFTRYGTLLNCEYDLFGANIGFENKIVTVGNNTNVYNAELSLIMSNLTNNFPYLSTTTIATDNYEVRCRIGTAPKSRLTILANIAGTIRTYTLSQSQTIAPEIYSETQLMQAPYITKISPLSDIIYNYDWLGEMNYFKTEHNATRIVDDYSEKQGIRTATVTLYGSVNHKYENGQLVVEWDGNADGRQTVLKLGQIVKILNKDKQPMSLYKNGDARLFKIMGIQTKIGGNSRFILELREAF